MLSAYMLHLAVLNVKSYVTMVQLAKLNYCGDNTVNWIAQTPFRLHLAFSSTLPFRNTTKGPTSHT